LVKTVTDEKKKKDVVEGTLAEYFGEGTEMSEETLNIAKAYAKKNQGRRRGTRLIESLDRYEKEKTKKPPVK
jgi:hypothetical protein